MKDYEVTIYCDGLGQEYAELATLTIKARTTEEALKKVKMGMRVSVEAL